MTDHTKFEQEQIAANVSATASSPAPDPTTPPTRQESAPAQKPPVTAAQKWLLLAVLLIGTAFRTGWGDSAIAAWGGWYGAFWLVAMAAVTPFIWRRLTGNRTAIAVGIAAAALCALGMAHANALQEELALLMLPGLPAVMMLYLVFAAYEIPVKREGEAARLALAGVFVYPFTGVPRFFAAIGALFSGEKRGVWKRVLPGVALGIPLAVAVALLLTGADANMARLFDRLLYEMPFWEWMRDILVVFVTAMLFYGVFARAIQNDRPPLPDPEPANWPVVTMAVTLIPALVVYVIFVCLQFSYLFGGSLPAALTYSEYARQGFTELNLVAAINFTLFGLCMRYVERSRLITSLCALLLIATGGVVASCIVRLLLYIGAYGLTILRILPLWLALFLAALTCLCAVRLARRSVPAMRIGGIAFLYWFVLLNLPDWGAVIASYNAAHGMG